jgi:hypothetical protein
MKESDWDKYVQKVAKEVFTPRFIPNRIFTSSARSIECKNNKKYFDKECNTVNKFIERYKEKEDEKRK